MKEVAFLLFVHIDSVDRLENLLTVSSILCEIEGINIYVWEVSPYCNGIYRKLKPKKVKYRFIPDDDPVLYRTKYLNEMVKDIKEEYVAIWDVDVICPLDQIRESIVRLQDGADFVYPYKHDFLDVPNEIKRMFLQNMDIGFLSSHKEFMNKLYVPNPVGGAFFANKRSYKECSLENQDFYGWGYEDGERAIRWEKAGKKVERVDGPLFHLSHVRGINSCVSSKELDLIRKRTFLKTLRGTIWKQ